MTPEERARKLVARFRHSPNISDWLYNQIQDAIAVEIREAVQEEREDCAKICEEPRPYQELSQFGLARSLAFAIRNRK